MFSAELSTSLGFSGLSVIYWVQTGAPFGSVQVGFWELQVVV